jgi:hypothetical protein
MSFFRTFLIFFIVILAGNGPLGAFSKPDDTPPIDLAVAAKAFEEARIASDRDGGALWGKPLYGPLLFVNPETKFAVANQADVEGKLAKQGTVWTGTLPETVSPANTALDWAGVRWTMVMWPLPQAKESRVRLMLHECFHRIQDDLGLPAASPGNVHLDTRDGRVWLQLEWRALERALVSTGETRRRAVADAIAFRNHRQSLTSAAATEENALECNEGLAEYTGVRCAALAPEDAVADALVALRRARGAKSFSRSFAYVSGPAYGVLLDAADPAWRQKLRAMKKKDMAAACAAAWRVQNSKPTKANLLERAARYDGSTLIAVETERETAHLARLADLRARFLDGPALVLPVADGFNFSFDPNDVTPVDDRMTFYGSLRVVAAWGVLEAPRGAVLVRNAQGDIISTRVPLAPNVPFDQQKEWNLQLAANWHAVPGERAGELRILPKE